MARKISPDSTAPFGPKAVRTASMSLSELDFEPGTILGDQWEIVRELRRGGHGVVYEVEEVHLGGTLAVKILDPVLMARSDMLKRFRGEVKLMRSFSHRHILKVFDYREDRESQLALISMEYVEGGTVRDLLDLARQQQTLVPLVLALRVLVQALDALVETHASGIVHRDISPANILLAGGSSRELLQEPLRDPGVKLADFGIASLVDQIRHSQEGGGMGTPSYVAPEMFHREVKVTPAIDLYSLGAVVWEMTTGHGPTVSSPRPSEMQENAPKELDEFLLALMDITVARRPNSKKARVRAEELLQQVHGSAGAPVSTHRAENSAAPLVGRHPAVRWMLGLAAALLVVMGSMRGARVEPSPEPAAATAATTHAIATGRAENSWIDPALDTSTAEVAEPDVERSEPQPAQTQPAEAEVDARPPGVYLKADRVAGTPVTADLLEMVAPQDPSIHNERPVDFENHLQGACLNRAVARGELLEWKDLDLCS